MNELERVIVADSFAAPPPHIVEAIDDELAHRNFAGAPHSLYSELWHIAYWQQVSLDWINGIETPIPQHASAGFPSPEETAEESWSQLCERFFAGMKEAGAHAADEANLDRMIRCPSLPGSETRVMSVRDQLISLAGHNAYHFGRIVLLRQLAEVWPPPSGGFTW